jgi:hypothetical protein
MPASVFVLPPLRHRLRYIGVNWLLPRLAHMSREENRQSPDDDDRNEKRNTHAQTITSLAPMQRYNSEDSQ